MVALALVLLELIPDAISTYTDIYNFPMLGVLMYETGETKTAYGSVTFLHSQLAVCAAENVFQLDPSNTDYITNSIISERIYVYAGTDLLHPPSWYETQKVKRIKVDEIIFGKDSKWAGAVDAKVLKNLQKFLQANNKSADELPSDIKGTASEVEDKLTRLHGYKFNPFHEFQWDVVLLVLASPLTWTPYILPIESFLWTTSAQLIKDYTKSWEVIEAVERKPHEYVPCSVPGWSPMGNNEIIYHRVVYIRYKECAESICGAYPSSCVKYLNTRHHICFKSLAFSDSCVIDQGAPVLCSWYPNKVIGILVKTFDCGSETLPSVVTRLNSIEVFAAIAQMPTKYAQQEPQLDDPKYTENPNI